MSEKLPYPEHLKRSYPPGTISDTRKIISCSDSNLWYMGLIGQVITVHYFATFGAWDTKGRWLWYYDLSGPIAPKADEPPPIKKQSWFKKLFK